MIVCIHVVVAVTYKVETLLQWLSNS